MHKFDAGFRKESTQSGYTLIELAIVMIVAGLMVASFMTAYNIYYKAKAEADTDETISNVTSNLAHYLAEFGSYPCPAPLDVPRTDPKYGFSGQCDVTNSTAYNALTNPAGPYITIPPGTFASGFWEEVSNRKIASTGVLALMNPTTFVPLGAATQGAVDATTTKALGTYSNRVRRGMIPFRTLGMMEEQAYDGYNMRLQYAVSEGLAVASTYMRTAGAIDIQDPKGQSLVKPTDMPDKDFTQVLVGATYETIGIKTTGGAAHYIVFSTGMDRVGGYSRDGQKLACGAAGLDTQNCNTAADSNAVYMVAPYSKAHTAKCGPTNTADCHFDDHVKYYSETQSPMWQVSTNFGKDITDVISAGGASALIGVGASPDSSRPGNLQVFGDVHARTALSASQLCDGNGTNCAALPLTSSCTAANTAAIQLANGKIDPLTNCPSTTTGGGQVACDPGKIAHGFNGNKLICSSVQACPMTLMPLCQPPDVAVADNRWLPGGRPNDVADSTLIAPLGVSGASYQEAWACQNGAWNRTATVGVCACTPDAGIPTPMGCDAYYGYGTGTYSGTVTITTATVCPSGLVTTTVGGAGGCTCNNGITTGFSNSADCDQGYTGGPLITTTTGTWACASKKWTWNTVTTGTCTCTGGTNSQDVACPFGYSGSVHQTSTLNCTTGNWGTFAPVINNPPPSGTNPDGSPQCQCVGGSDYQTVACGSGQIGTMVQERTFDCTKSPPDWTGWNTIDNSGCAALSYSWRPVGAPTSGYGSALAYNLYDSCSTPGVTVSCSAPNGSSYDHYNNSGCQCE